MSTTETSRPRQMWQTLMVLNYSEKAMWVLPSVPSPLSICATSIANGSIWSLLNLLMDLTDHTQPCLWTIVFGVYGMYNYFVRVALL